MASESDEKEVFAGVSGLKARFEQLAQVPVSSSAGVMRKTQSLASAPLSRSSSATRSSTSTDGQVVSMPAAAKKPAKLEVQEVTVPEGDTEVEMDAAEQQAVSSQSSRASTISPIPIQPPTQRVSPPPRPPPLAQSPEAISSSASAPGTPSARSALPSSTTALPGTLPVKKVPPPVPASRKLGQPAATAPPALIASADSDSSESLTTPRPGGVPMRSSHSVKLLASRYTQSPASTPTPSRPPSVHDDPPPVLMGGAEVILPGTSSSEMQIPGEELEPSRESPRVQSPPIPQRPTRSLDFVTSISSVPLPAVRAVPPPIPTRLTSTASVSVTPPTPTPSASLPLPPPPSRTLSPSRHAQSIPSIPLKPVLPFRPASASAPPIPSPHIASETQAYRPPPPPARSVNATLRVEPKRPILSTSSAGSGDESSDDDEGDDTFSKSQEYPDSTFANRRPPSLRNRKSIFATTYFSSFAIRGNKVVHAGQHHAYIWHPGHLGGVAESIALPSAEQKVLCLEFRGAGVDEPGDDARYVWGGTKEGNVFQLDLLNLHLSDHRHGCHSGASVVGVYRLGRSMLTLDDTGKLLLWGQFDSPTPPELSSSPKVQRLGEKLNFHALLGNELWTSTGPTATKGGQIGHGRGPLIKVFNPTLSLADGFVVTPRGITTPDSAGQIGSVTAGAIVPATPHLVFLAHDNGYVSVWDRASYSCILVQRISPFGITAMAGVGRCLWAGFRSGMINVYDVVLDPWVVIKAWKAHKDAVTKILIDPATLWMDETLQIASSGTDMAIHLWDGFLRDDWLNNELNLRQREFCTFRTIRILCISWNVDAAKPHDLTGGVQNYEFLTECLQSVESPDVISFGFQEMIDLENKKLAAKTMLLGKKKVEQKFADGVSSSYRAWHDKLVQAVRLAMPPESPYTVVHVGDMVGLFSCIFVKNAERAGLRDLALTTVKRGMGGRYGNKGALLSRFVLDDTSLLFINCHLAAGQGHRRQRDQDLRDILEGNSGFDELATSSPGAYAAGGGGTLVFDHELCILSGDLNYRIDMRRDAVLKAIQDGQLSTLWAQDQLLKNLATNQSFRLRSFKEAPIDFEPTYKYDPGTDNYDSSGKRRIPAWCDRILWRADRGDKVKVLHYRRYECNISDHRPISGAYDMEVKSIVPDKREVVWKEVESAWFGVESHKLEEAKQYYGGM